MMRRVVWIVVAGAVAVAIAWWVASLPGRVAVDFAGLTIETTTPVAVVLAAVAGLALLLLLRLLLALIALPRTLRGWRRRRRQAGGEQAVTRTLVALAAGDVAARRLAGTRAAAAGRHAADAAARRGSGPAGGRQFRGGGLLSPPRRARRCRLHRPARPVPPGDGARGLAGGLGARPPRRGGSSRCAVVARGTRHVGGAHRRLEPGADARGRHDRSHRLRPPAAAEAEADPAGAEAGAAGLAGQSCLRPRRARLRAAVARGRGANPRQEAIRDVLESRAASGPGGVRVRGADRPDRARARGVEAGVG